MNTPFRNLNFSRHDFLSSLGLQTRSRGARMMLPAMGMFGVGLVVGAGLGLLFAPKPGARTREVIGSGISEVARKVTSRVRRARDAATGHGDDFEVTPRTDTGRNGPSAANTSRT